LKIIPSLKTMIIGCVDPRVDPVEIFGLEPGEAAVIRNVGGRITPSTLQTMAMLRVVAKESGGEIGPDGISLFCITPIAASTASRRRSSQSTLALARHNSTLCS
jgi:hypothetical protein